mgnify:CR=1 FL=1
MLFEDAAPLTSFSVGNIHYSVLIVKPHSFTKMGRMGRSGSFWVVLGCFSVRPISKSSNDQPPGRFLVSRLFRK